MFCIETNYPASKPIVLHRNQLSGIEANCRLPITYVPLLLH